MGSDSVDSLTFVLDSISMLEMVNPVCKTLKSPLETLYKPCSRRVLAIILDSSALFSYPATIGQSLRDQAASTYFKLFR